MTQFFVQALAFLLFAAGVIDTIVRANERQNTVMRAALEDIDARRAAQARNQIRAEEGQL